MGPAVTVVRSDDPRCSELRAARHRVVAESWGARLRIASEHDLDASRLALQRATVSGIHVRELDEGWADAVQALVRATAGDFPLTPATPPPDDGDDAILLLWANGGHVFGVVEDDEVVAVTAIATILDRESYAETAFTTVRADRRGRGLASAVKAASILRLCDGGTMLFATGGAAENTGSIRMNERLGYVIEERWLGFAAPDDHG